MRPYTERERVRERERERENARAMLLARGLIEREKTGILTGRGCGIANDLLVGCAYMYRPGSFDLL